jgi:hypothetical protein
MSLRSSFSKRTWIAADATERGLIVPTAADIGSHCWQEDTGKLYVLTAATPVTWAPYSTEANVTAAVAAEAALRATGDSDEATARAAADSAHTALLTGVHGIVRSRLSGDFSTTDAGAPYQDVTGTALSLASGATYRFMFGVVFQTAAITTGIKLTINGPSQSLLAYKVDIPITADLDVVGYRRAYQSGTIGTAVDAADSNLYAIVQGVVVTTASGSLVLRVATEVAGSAVTVKAGTVGEAVRFA